MGVVTIFLEEGKRGKGEEGSSDSAREGGNKERRAGWAGLGGSRLKGRRVGGWERERLARGRGDCTRGKGDRPDPKSSHINS